ncbi:MAG: 3-phosphoshikimate 1-carboxyvinyltransferase [Muribaculaceae bacterium]|nr:3-phosphoshikimate 1-carboxyvinyltransferase [Muribaculaceae bacterium]
MDYRIFPPEEIPEAEVSVPLSKSMSNRALLMHALATGEYPDFSVARCDDTEMMISALSGGIRGNVNIGAAGTAMRFLTAYYAATPGAEVLLDGSERMRKRPIGPLVDALRSCGADITYKGAEGFPPLHIKGTRLHGGSYEIDASISSQFVSALLMMAPTFDSDFRLTLKGEISSLPYLDMTVAMMRYRGINVEREHTMIYVTPGLYREPEHSDIERDWSAASYWYEVAALSAGWITITDLSLPSLQGDSVAATLFDKLGVITNANTDGGIELSASPEVYSRLDVDFSDNPDLVQTLVVACGMLGVPFSFTGVRSLRIKETDRLEALCHEMAKFGIILTTEKDNEIKWDGRRVPIREIPVIDTYDDHRMAMAFAPAAMYIPGLVIKGCETVNKSYPSFWENMQKIGFILTDPSITEEIPEV